MVTGFKVMNLLYCIKSLAALCVIFMLGGAGIAAAAEVEAQLDRESAAAGNGAILSIKVSGSDAGQPELPTLENFVIQPRGQSQQIQMVNGRTTRSISYTYVVGSEVPGDYEIPPIGVMVNGRKVFTKPLRLKVLDAAAAQAQGGAAGGAPQEENEEDEAKRFGFLTVELADAERKHAYVGEIAPVRIRAWLPAESRAQLRSGIQPEGKAFTLHNVSGQPQQTEEMRDGKRYLVVTWYGGMSATKAGKYPASLSLNATVAVRDRSAPQPRRQMGGPFGDPFFDQVFDQMNVPMVEKDVTLKSDDQLIEVRPLPVEGRPAGFMGAVGNFQMDGVEIPENWTTGEPQQIGVRVSGSGNFALMKAPELLPGDAWKVYPGKASFSAGDEASFSGSQTFRFSAVPRKGGAQKLALRLSYFNPEEGVYKTITSAVKDLRVAGDDLKELPPEPVPEASQPEKKPDALLAQRAQPTGRVELAPLSERREFRWMLSLSGLLVVLAAVVKGLRRRWSDPQRAAGLAVEKATREALSTAERCVVAKDVSGFFAAARVAIQQRLGSLWGQAPQAITLAEIMERMPADSGLVKLFREADRHAYGRDVSGELGREWQDLLDEVMGQLRPPAR
jgi:hypothetical protein